MRTLAKMNLSLKIKVIQLIANAKVASPDATFRPEDSTNQLRNLYVYSVMERTFNRIAA
jgi:hypothetical protein